MKRRTKEFLKESKDAVINSIEFFNRPNESGRVWLTLSCLNHAFEMIMKAIIIDDEEGARRLLKNALEEHNTNVEVLQTCANVPEGVLAINQLEPDVVFLDIEMPNENGFKLFDFKNIVSLFTSCYH